MKNSQMALSGRLFLPAQELELTSLRGYCAAHSGSLVLVTEPLFVYARVPNSARRVGIVSGGGSGHEPMHVGFVGNGGIDAAVPGRVFASPHNHQVYEASRRVAGCDGVLHVVKNYTGDRIHFGIAAERLEEEGIPVARVLVNDDLATDTAETGTGRRGTGATVIVEKLLGALADRGASLARLKEFGDRVVAESRSLAVASGPLTSFVTCQPAFEVAPGTIEYGIGIHGESAPHTTSALDLVSLVTQMVEGLLAAIPGVTDRVIALVNGLGSTSALELGAVMHTVEMVLRDRSIVIDSALVGTFVSALDMRGFLITLTKTNDERTGLWLQESRLPGLPVTSRYEPVGADPAANPNMGLQQSNPFLERVFEYVHDAHGALTRLDQLAGDGDFGDNLLSGVEHARRNIGSEPGVSQLASSFLNAVGGTSGPLFGLVLAAIAEEDGAENNTQPRSARDAARILQIGVEKGMGAIQRAGGAVPGDRTMLDALVGVCTTEPRDVATLLRAAVHGTLSTAQMRARQGRASYVGDRAIGVPDAGAVGVTLLLAAIAAYLDESCSSDCSQLILDLMAEVDKLSTS